jgi:hypothetical protein
MKCTRFNIRNEKTFSLYIPKSDNHEERVNFTRSWLTLIPPRTLPIIDPTYTDQRMNQAPNTANDKTMNCYGKKLPTLAVMVAAIFVACGVAVEIDVESEVGSTPSAEAMEDVRALGRAMQMPTRRSP